MPVIIKNPFFSKKIKDATIIPQDVASGKVGYANGHKRIVGTHICKKRCQIMKVAKGEIISMAASSGDQMQDYDRCAHYAKSGVGDPPEYMYMSVGKYFSNVAILELGRDDDYNTYSTVVKKQSCNVRYGENTNLFVTIDGIRLNIFLGKPIDSSYSYMDPTNFTNKNIFSLQFESDFLEFLYKNVSGSRIRLYFYIKTDQGIITEFGLAIKGNTGISLYTDHDIEFGIEWI